MPSLSRAARVPPDQRPEAVAARLRRLLRREGPRAALGVLDRWRSEGMVTSFGTGGTAGSGAWDDAFALALGDTTRWALLDPAAWAPDGPSPFFLHQLSVAQTAPQLLGLLSHPAHQVRTGALRAHGHGRYRGFCPPDAAPRGLVPGVRLTQLDPEVLRAGLAPETHLDVIRASLEHLPRAVVDVPGVLRALGRRVQRAAEFREQGAPDARREWGGARGVSVRSTGRGVMHRIRVPGLSSPVIAHPVLDGVVARPDLTAPELGALLDQVGPGVLASTVDPALPWEQLGAAALEPVLRVPGLGVLLVDRLERAGRLSRAQLSVVLLDVWTRHGPLVWPALGPLLRKPETLRVLSPEAVGRLLHAATRDERLEILRGLGQPAAAAPAPVLVAGAGG